MSSDTTTSNDSTDSTDSTRSANPAAESRTDPASEPSEASRHDEADDPVSGERTEQFTWIDDPLLPPRHAESVAAPPVTPPAAPHAGAHAPAAPGGPAATAATKIGTPSDGIAPYAPALVPAAQRPRGPSVGTTLIGLLLLTVAGLVGTGLGGVVVPLWALGPALALGFGGVLVLLGLMTLLRRSAD